MTDLGFTYRPESLTGYYQYEPVLGDQAFIGVILLKDNGGSWDTIADGNFTSTSTLLNWTPFTATITYHSTETPTHLNIIIMSSDRNALQPNSTLYVDNLSFTYPASVNENLTNETDIFLTDGMINIFVIPAIFQFRVFSCLLLKEKNCLKPLYTTLHRIILVSRLSLNIQAFF